MQNGPTASCGVFSLSANISRDDLHNLPECKSQTKRKKKIAAAVYLYQVDNDGEWGEISFDFEAGTAEIIRLAEWDTMASKMFATKVVALILKNGDLQVKEFILPVSY